MNDFGKKFEIFVIVSVIALIGVIYAFRQQSDLAPTTSNPNITQGEQNINSRPSNQTSAEQMLPQVPSSVIEYQGQDGKNALELLQANHRVDVQHFSFGDLVTGIDGITPDAKHFWAMYVNGQFSQLGASAYATKSTDTIKWQIDAVIDTTK